jgi:hypothetical protein
MGGSNERWGQLQREDPETAELWDQGGPLPEPGAEPLFDALLAAKHITRQAIARTGCRMADAAEPTLMWAWPGGAKWRRLDTGKRWNSLAPSWKRAHIMDALDGRAAVVLLVAEGETDAARLSLLYPFAAVAVLPLGADYLPPKLPEQAAAYEAVYLCHDADEAGDQGAERGKRAMPQAVRHRPPDDTDWCDWPSGTDPPPLAKPPDACGSIVFEDFAKVLAEGVPDPLQLIPDVLYEEGVHWFSGEPGCGKTTLSAAFAVQVMLTGGHVVWLDYEGGMGPTVRRFDAVGLSPKVAAERFHYAGWPTNAEESMAAVAAKYPKALVVFDSASKAQSMKGIDENANTEVTSWTMSLVRAAKQHHLALLIIDHVSKGSTSAYARGAGAKQADTDVHWRVQTVTKFKRDSAGMVVLRNSKDREGFFPEIQWFAVGDGQGNLPVTPCEQPTEAELAESAPVVYNPPKSAF